MTPAPAQAVVRVNRKAAARVASGHPWIYSGDVEDRGGASPGDAVRVTDTRGRTLGVAHYSSTSQICLRMLDHRVVAVGREFLRERLEAAMAYRRRVVDDTDAFRVVHGEADGLPALVVDRYGDYLVVQLLDQGMDRLRSEIVACLTDLLAPKGIIERSEAPVRARESLPLVTGALAGEIPARAAYRMNGLNWEADLISGQKTGGFLDQRENYRAALAYARGRVLDCFASAGGFAIHLAARAGSVEAVDSSASALALASRNASLNGIGNIEFHEANVFDLLTGFRGSGRHFDMVVLDPPAFAKSRASLPQAGRGYKEINLRAIELLAPGGVLVTCSCSHHLSEAEFLGIVASAALDAGRTLRVIERRTQSRDHPILLTVAETHYLKCLILEAA